MDASVRVLIVDHEELFRKGLTILFDKDPDVTVVGQARTGAEAIDKARALRPTVVLTELELPDRNGLTVARAIVRELPETRIALIARSFSRDDLIEAARSGVHGYLTKDITLTQLVDAVKRVSGGEAFISAGSSAMLIEELAASGGSVRPPVQPVQGSGTARQGERAKVTDREREVLELIVQGATNRDIARRLMITENTVKVHLRNILDKLHLRNRQQAAAFAVSSGLVNVHADTGEPGNGGQDPTSIPWRQRRTS